MYRILWVKNDRIQASQYMELWLALQWLDYFNTNYNTYHFLQRW